MNEQLEKWKPVAVSHHDQTTEYDGKKITTPRTVVMFKSDHTGDLKSWGTEGTFTLAQLLGDGKIEGASA